MLENTRESPPLAPAAGLHAFNLPLVFTCAVELSEAVARVTPSKWGDLPVDIEGPASPHFDRWGEWNSRLSRIEEESTRLKRALGATGALTCDDRMRDYGDARSKTCLPKWESFDRRFSDTAHDRIVRLALLKLATAAIDLSGFATWRDPQWDMREQGLRLLTWGLAQLWDGLTADERSSVRDRLKRTQIVIGWPGDPTIEPPRYHGPEAIPLQDQYRAIDRDGYFACYKGYLNDVQDADSGRIRQGQERFLRRATLTQFVESAERAAEALRAMAKGEFDTPGEWGKLYTKAFYPLACLRRAKQVAPVGVWPDDAIEQRNLLVEAAHVLLVWVGGTPESKEALKPADVETAFGAFTRAADQLRQIANRETAKAAVQSQPAVDVEKLKSLTGWTPPQPEQDVDAIRMTITEAAKFVGVTDRTIREWRANGKLKVVPDKDGHLVFSKSTLHMLRDSR